MEMGGAIFPNLEPIWNIKRPWSVAKAGERTERVTLVIAELGYRVAGAEGES